jgi:hypothetical protein
MKQLSQIYECVFKSLYFVSNNTVKHVVYPPPPKNRLFQFFRRWALQNFIYKIFKVWGD